MKGVIWTKDIFEEFVSRAMLNDEEIAVVKASIKGDSHVAMSFDLNMSVAKINRILRRCRIKYDVAQKESDILPIRKRSINDTF